MKGLTPAGIEYGELNWNFYPGCLHKQQGKCPLPNCWAEGMSKRKKEDFHKPHLIPERLLAPLSRKKPARILVNFMGDLGGDWVDPEMPIPFIEGCSVVNNHGGTTLREIMMFVMAWSPQHQFLFLTKNPAGYAKWGEWPDNAWLGATATDNKAAWNSVADMVNTGLEAKNKWLSLEPLLGEIDARSFSNFSAHGIKWVVIGGQTNPVRMPEIEWVKEIVEACDAAGVRVWEKNNMGTLLKRPLRQELPWPIQQKV